MLQRLVRSMVSTAPRPCLIDEVPWLCRRSVTASKSRPGKSDSILCKNAGLIDSVSVNTPCVGQVFSITIFPSRSTIDAGISPTCWLTSDSTDRSPERNLARVSRTQLGQSESVVRGQPRVGLVRCSLFISGAAAHCGWNEVPGNRLFTVWNTGHASLAPVVSIISTGFHQLMRNSSP